MGTPLASKSMLIYDSHDGIIVGVVVKHIAPFRLIHRYRKMLKVIPLLYFPTTILLNVKRVKFKYARSSVYTTHSKWYSVTKRSKIILP